MVRNSSSPPARAHFVVDGSNIATEGRSVPSLQQLNDAVLAFMDEHPDALITVVVDATFGHRIDKKEVKEFDAAVANNELVTPPAGAVGRGDAFVLSIANKAKAGILSNDSFQEFHGQYDWLFDQGRLIGGKPVPHVGWVFVERTPVRGPKSRQSVKEAKSSDTTTPATTASTTAGRRSRRGGAATSSGSPLADAPLPVPSAPPPGPARTAAAVVIAPEPAEVVAAATAAASAPHTASRAAVNELVPFLEFVERHPVGTSCTAVVESYSSHGAYARADAVLVYIPLRLMDEPPPRSARSRLKLGEAVTLVVVGYAPERRSVDAALPHMTPEIVVAEPASSTPRKPRRTSKKAADAAVEGVPASTHPADDTVAAAPSTARRRGRAKPLEPAQAPSQQGPAAKTDSDATKKSSRRTTRADAAPAKPEPRAERPAGKPAALKPTAAKSGAKQPTVEPTAKTAPARKATAKKATATKATATKATARKAPAKKATATKATATKSTAKKSSNTGRSARAAQVDG